MATGSRVPLPMMPPELSSSKAEGLGVTLATQQRDNLEVQSCHCDRDVLCIFVFNCMFGLVRRVLHSRTLRSCLCIRTTRGVCFCLVKNLQSVMP